MALRKCDKCELNYIMDDQPYCSVCMKEMKGLDHHDDDGDVCPLCGEREVAFGQEYCNECLSDLKKLDSKHVEEEEEDVVEEEEHLDVIEDLPIDEEVETAPPFELENINEELDEEGTFSDDEDAEDELDEEGSEENED